MHSPTRRASLLPFLVWLVLFYGAWLALVVAGGHLQALREHWPIGLAMAIGSYVAGSTPMGGGALGFPVLVLMAFTSLVGIATKLLLGGVEAGTYENWLAAAPVVALGAPLGALVVSRVGRRPTLYVVSVLCVAQFVGTLLRERDSLTAWALAATVLGVVLFLLVFQEMYREGTDSPVAAAGAAARTDHRADSPWWPLPILPGATLTTLAQPRGSHRAGLACAPRRRCGARGGTDPEPRRRNSGT